MSDQVAMNFWEVSVDDEFDTLLADLLSDIEENSEAERRGSQPRWAANIERGR